MGRLQPRVAWEQISIARSNGCPPLGPNRKHPCPRTRWHAYWLQPVSSTMASLYGVCLKGVEDLLNCTLPAAGTSGSTKQVWGLLEQDSIYGQLWRFIISLHDMYNKYISTIRITAHYTLLCHIGHNRPDGDRWQAHAYPRQRLSRIPFRHACKAHEDDYLHKCVYFQ